MKKNNVLQQAQNNAAHTTQNQISETLLQFPEQVINASQLNNPQMAADIKNRENLLSTLTTNIPGGDTLYLSDADDSMADTVMVLGNQHPPTIIILILIRCLHL